MPTIAVASSSSCLGPAVEAESKLRQWVQQHGAEVSDAITAVPIPEMGGGFGVVVAGGSTSQKPLGPGTVVARIPKRLLVTAAVARRTYGLPKSVPPVEAIIVFLVCERLRATSGDEDAGLTWSTWIRGLPRRYDNFLEFQDVRASAEEGGGVECGSDGVDEGWLQPFLPLPRYREKVLLELRVFHALADRVLRDHQSVFAKVTADPSARVTRALVRWAFNSLMSRGFSYSSETWAMVPWVDYFNYATTPNVHPDEDSKGGFVFTTSTRRGGGSTAARPGSQLLLSYGVYTDFELALWYGFTLCRGITEHQANCSYMLSPMADTDGVYPSGCEWAVQLLRAIGLETVPPSWLPVSRADVGACRLYRQGVSPSMRLLVQDMAESNRTTIAAVDIVRRIVSYELREVAPSPAAAAAAAVAANDDSTTAAAAAATALPVVGFARQVVADSVDLLQGILAKDDERLAAWLDRTL